MAKPTSLIDVAAFVATIIHDIKNPIAMIQMVGQDLQQAESMDATELQRRGEQLLCASQRLLELTNRMSKVPRRRIKCEQSDDLGELVQTSLQNYASKLTNSGIEVSVQSVPAITTWVDPRALGTVLELLLDNACEALQTAPEGRLQVNVEQDGAFALIRVRDNGPGVPTDLMEQVYKPFFTTKTGDQHLGLGLTVARQAVAQMMGQLDLEPGKGGGTTVSIRLLAKAPGPLRQ